MSKKGRAQNKIRKAARRIEDATTHRTLIDREAIALLATFEALDTHPSLTGPGLTPDTWRWAIYGAARRNLLAGYENHNHPIQMGDASVSPRSVTLAFDDYQSRNKPRAATGIDAAGDGAALPPQEWLSALEHHDRTALVRHYLRRAEDITDPFGDPDMQDWIEEFTKALEAQPMEDFATIASYLTGLQYPRLLTLSGPVFAPHSTATSLHHKMLSDATVTREDSSV